MAFIFHGSRIRQCHGVIEYKIIPIGHSIHNLNCSFPNRFPPEKKTQVNASKIAGAIPRISPRQHQIVQRDLSSMMRRQDNFFSDNYTDQTKDLYFWVKLFPVTGVFPAFDVPSRPAITSDLNKQNLLASNTPTVHQSITEPRDQIDQDFYSVPQR